MDPCFEKTHNKLLIYTNNNSEKESCHDMSNGLKDVSSLKQKVSINLAKNVLPISMFISC